MRGLYSAILVSLVIASQTACGCSTPPPEEPTAEEPTGAAVDSADDVEQTGAPEKTAEEGEQSSGSQAKSGPEPEFKEGMSVNDAINAVPPATERENIEPEVLGKPLAEPVAWYGPIVMNTEAELRQAFEEMRNGTFIR